MHVVSLASETDFDGWRAGARRLRLAGAPPHEAAFSVGGQALFDAPLPAAEGQAFSAPRAFLDLAERVILHRKEDRFDLLYRLLWRLKDEPNLMRHETDADVADALDRAKNVSRAAHKMKAFVRFRPVDAAETAFCAWFEPAHRVAELTAPFFARRFSTMAFSILTPDLCAHWDTQALSFTPGVDRSHAPKGDEIEVFWATYYASTFNPARLKPAMMQSEMPKRYWRNLPEARLIPDLMAQAEQRERAMVRAGPTEPARYAEKALRRVPARSADEDRAPGSLADIAARLDGCRRCDLWRGATQGVPGEGPAQARLMFVGEQPGDQEDLSGKPFVGPAGKLFDRALAEAGIDRSDVYVTNAVKHFKYELRGKRRLHKTPDAGEVQACRWWLDHERRLARPRVIVALGGTAARAVLGKAVAVTKVRGRPLALEDGAEGLVTVHPSYLLRLPDETAKAAAYKAFVEDLRTAGRLARGTAA
ncbi:UdgX family uracil-DNA binding protein [Brevundimonas sp. 2R-24]|uniref:Type-4 uracil-DNA glycosylase n=1 Tax=Peiella sedimenti TaxID=3061083 RepID=A0ABT8SNB8_9CAUL|nr:UdgX family uracil-DNA binding protein [Caulobacteraceae bacterium XZ-24]